MSEAGDSIWAALRARARGYLVKGSTKTEITNAIAVAASDGMVFGPAVAERLQTAFRSNGRHPTRSRPHRRKQRSSDSSHEDATTPKWPPR